MTDRDYSRGNDHRKFPSGCGMCGAEVGTMHRADCVFKDVRVSQGRLPLLDGPVPPKPAAQGKREPTGADVARTALHVLEVQGVEALKDFLIRTTELEAARKSFTGNT